jgi:hypothetical protein
MASGQQADQDLEYRVPLAYYNVADCGLEFIERGD